ncbi:MAG TPA: hypothetical protein PKL65_14520 [Bacteroidales bacterium]|nr:hypothetical protein [Bacteroidales bacterium]
MKKFFLDPGETGKIIRGFQFFFGIICVVVAIAWLILYPDPVKSGISFWVSFLFLSLFGIYQINAGAGRGRRFIGVGDKSLSLKRIALLPPRSINYDEIIKIEIFPLSIVLILKSGRHITIRLGTTYTDIITPLKDAVAIRAEEMKIPVEFREAENHNSSSG